VIPVDLHDIAAHPCSYVAQLAIGSEWRLHRLWFERSAMADLLGADDALVEKNALYRCLDKLLEHKAALFSHLRERWQDLFGADFEVLLYDLTSTYFESPPPDDEDDKRRHGGQGSVLLNEMSFTACKRYTETNPIPIDPLRDAIEAMGKAMAER
jgi:hypothetical protein